MKLGQVVYTVEEYPGIRPREFRLDIASHRVIGFDGETVVALGQSNVVELITWKPRGVVLETKREAEGKRLERKAALEAQGCKVWE